MRSVWNPKHLLPGLLILGLIVGMLVWVAQTPQAARPASSSDPTVVVLTASWCGTCREITPVVRRIADATPGLKMVTLDVDSANAPVEARNYGISISGSEIPQVYLYKNGRTILLFNGQNYKFGHSKQAEEQIRQQLQSNL